jgi:hypothetical protein
VHCTCLLSGVKRLAAHVNRQRLGLRSKRLMRGQAGMKIPTRQAAHMTIVIFVADPTDRLLHPLRIPRRDSQSKSLRLVFLCRAFLFPAAAQSRTETTL